MLDCTETTECFFSFPRCIVVTRYFQAPCVVLFNSATECNGLVKGKLHFEEPKVLVLVPLTLEHQTLVLTLLVSVAAN